MEKDNRYECEDCGAIFTTEDALMAHKKLEAAEEDKKELEEDSERSEHDSAPPVGPFPSA